MESTGKTLRFDGQVALVTGAGKGLGRAYAEALAERGARIVVNNRHRSGAPEPGSAAVVAEGIRSRGGEAVANRESVEEEGAGARMVEHTLDSYGRIDVLVCNAGIGRGKMFHKMSLDEVREVLAINLMGTLAPLHAALPRMRAAGHGRIVTNTSNAGMYGALGFAAYAASKSAMHGLVPSLAEENVARGVQINAVLPFAHTTMSAPALSDESLPERTAERLGVEFVANLVVWLASRECAVTGRIFIAGGGIYRRARMIQNRGLEAARCTPEWLAEHVDALCRMDDLLFYEDTRSMLEDVAERARDQT